MLSLPDLKRRAVEWQGKRLRLKRTAIVAALSIAAVLIVVLTKLSNGQDVRWTVAVAAFVVALIVCLGSLTALTNTTLVAMYYAACVQFIEAPEELELVTGTLEEVSRVQMPYIGMLCQVTLRVAGAEVSYYCPGKLLAGVQPAERVRLRTHDTFAIRVERVERPAS